MAEVTLDEVEIQLDGIVVIPVDKHNSTDIVVTDVDMLQAIIDKHKQMVFEASV
jgi:hypothetical protein